VLINKDTETWRVVTASPQACEVAEIDHRPKRELLGGPYVLAEEAAEDGPALDLLP